MKRIAILGAESSHAKHFLSYVQNIPEFSDIQIVGIYSDEVQASEALSEEFGVKIMKSADELAGTIDGLVITARNGNMHYSLAKPYIKDKIPMLIDKPITQSNNDALMLISELERAKISATGGSSLKYNATVQDLKNALKRSKKCLGGTVRAPLMSKSSYGGFFFYAPHLIEIVCEIFGRYPQSVRAQTDKDQTTVVFKYRNFECTGIYTEGLHRYYAEINTDNGVCGQEIYPDEKNDLLVKQFSDFHSLLHGKKQMHSYSELIAPVFIASAIKRSIDNNGIEQAISYIS